MAAEAKHVLTINSGSSSLKFARYRGGPGVQVTWSGTIDRIGLPGGAMRIRDAAGHPLSTRQIDAASHADGVKALLDWLHSEHAADSIDAIGHRLVHGGREYSQPQLLDDTVLDALRKLVPLAPNHLPAELSALELLRRHYPQVPQVACFDTAFHRTMPAVAQFFGLPRRYYDAGILRYGFHGLSYEYLLQELARIAGDETARGRLIMAHLGNGASMAAVRDGRSLDTTMGLTPIGGLVMSTRSGDLDPGVLLYLLEQQGDTPGQLRAAVDRQGGLLGVSARSSDMRELLAAEAADTHAAEAVALFCYSARKAICALAAVLGGVDTLIFSGGIGENAAEIRRRIGENLEFLGISIDPARNASHAPIISPDGGRATVRVITTNEDEMIARHTYRLLWGGQ
jgi:acetate kinase